MTTVTPSIAHLRRAARRSDDDELELGIRVSLSWVIAAFYDCPIDPNARTG